MKLNKHYSINDGKGSIIFSEGNSGTINAEYDIKGNKSTGTFNGILENETLKGTFYVDSVAGLMEFTFSESGFETKWKKGIEPGPMKGEWKGTLNTENITETKSKSVEKPLIKKEKIGKNTVETVAKKPIEKEKEITKEQKEVKQSKNKYVPLTTTKKWQPFFKEVSRQLRPDINWENKNFTGLLKWLEFLIKEDYLLIQPIEDGSEYLAIFNIIWNDQNKTNSHPELIASRKYYPVLLRQCLTHLLKREKIKFYWHNFRAIKICEPEVYKEFVIAFSELSYEEKDLNRYVLDSIDIYSLLPIYKDFLPLLKALKSQITYSVDDIAKYPELEFWKDYTDKYLKNELKFSDYLASYFYNFNERDYRIFDSIFKYIKKNKEFSYHLQNYVYYNLNGSTDKELCQRHIHLLEYIVESGKAELADELYMEKMEFEKKFPG